MKTNDFLFTKKPYKAVQAGDTLVCGIGLNDSLRKCSHSPTYQTWAGLLRYVVENPSFSICSEWKKLSGFALWFKTREALKAKHPDYIFDTLWLSRSRSRVFSPDTIALIPRSLSAFLTRTNSNTVSGYPGVKQVGSKFKAVIPTVMADFGIPVPVGSTKLFDNAVDAQMVYLRLKQMVLAHILVKFEIDESVKLNAFQFYKRMEKQIAKHQPINDLTDLFN